MRASDVRIGETYLCRIGSRLARVTVTARHRSEPSTSGRKRPDVFCVRKVGTTVDLPKHRSATALRPCPESPPAKPCFFCHETNGHTLECYQAQYEPYADKVKKHLDPPEELEEFPDAAPPSELCKQAYINAAKAAKAAGCNLEEIEKAGQQAFDKQSNGELIAQGYLPCAAIPPCPVSQEYYLSAAENGVGWCTHCKMFRGEDLEPNSHEHECPECHQYTLYGAELALSTGYIKPIED